MPAIRPRAALGPAQGPGVLGSPPNGPAGQSGHSGCITHKDASASTARRTARNVTDHAVRQPDHHAPPIKPRPQGPRAARQQTELARRSAAESQPRRRQTPHRQHTASPEDESSAGAPPPPAQHTGSGERGGPVGARPSRPRPKGGKARLRNGEVTPPQRQPRRRADARPEGHRGARARRGHGPRAARARPPGRAPARRANRAARRANRTVSDDDRGRRGPQGPDSGSDATRNRRSGGPPAPRGIV